MFFCWATFSTLSAQPLSLIRNLWNSAKVFRYFTGQCYEPILGIKGRVYFGRISIHENLKLFCIENLSISIESFICDFPIKQYPTNKFNPKYASPHQVHKV